MSPRADASIVVIAFNEASTVSDCVSALLSQRTSRSIEVVVVDDGSTDQTRERVQRLAERDRRVKLVPHEHNRGRGAARSTGLGAADAALIGYVDADVIVPPDWLERCVAALGTNRAVSGVATPDGDCVVLVRLVHPTTRVRRHTMAISGGNVLFDERVLREVGFDEGARLGEDFRLARRMTALGYSIATVPGLVAEHRETQVVPQRASDGCGRTASTRHDSPSSSAIVRVPDLAWLVWILPLGLVVALAIAGALAWAVAGGVLVGCTVAIAGAHTVSRFRLRPRTLRWLAAAVLDVPLVSSYLAGRTAGLPPRTPLRSSRDRTEAAEPALRATDVAAAGTPWVVAPALGLREEASEDRCGSAPVEARVQAPEARRQVGVRGAHLEPVIDRIGQLADGTGSDDGSGDPVIDQPRRVVAGVVDAHDGRPEREALGNRQPESLSVRRTDEDRLRP